jgi:hypothetical protein
MDVIPPPARPFEAYAGPWEPIEAELGTPLPQEYKDIVRVYGSGQFLEFFGLYMPKSRDRWVRLATAVPSACSAFEDDKDLPFALWPAPGGLVPIGQTDNGDYLFLRPSDSLTSWEVVVWDRGDLDFRAINCGLTDFIVGLATGKLKAEPMPDDLHTCDHPFVPFHPTNDWRSGEGRHLIGIRAYYRFQWDWWRLP